MSTYWFICCCYHQQHIVQMINEHLANSENKTYTIHTFFDAQKMGKFQLNKKCQTQKPLFRIYMCSHLLFVDIKEIHHILKWIAYHFNQIARCFDTRTHTKKKTNSACDIPDNENSVIIQNHSIDTLNCYNRIQLNCLKRCYAIWRCRWTNSSQVVSCLLEQLSVWSLTSFVCMY